MRSKNTFLLLLAVLLAGRLSAQQEPMQTQFMYNKLAYNPGYAGSFASPSLVLQHRSQWVGIEGAPNTQELTYSQPLLSNHFGLGFGLQRHQIGISRNLTFTGAYAYQLALPRGYLGIGLQVNARNYRQNWTDSRLVTTQPTSIDNAVPGDVRSRTIVNFGFGVFYTGPRWYAGVAAPRLVKNSIDFADTGGVISKNVQHFNLMTGVTLDLSPGVEMTPQLLLKYVQNAPPDADVNLSFVFQRKFHTGLTYRTGGNKSGVGESVDLMVGAQATRNLFLLLSYDIGMSRLRQFTAGSFEATARWWFNPPEGDQTVNPNRPF